MCERKKPPKNFWGFFDEGFQATGTRFHVVPSGFEFLVLRMALSHKVRDICFVCGFSVRFLASFLQESYTNMLGDPRVFFGKSFLILSFFFLLVLSFSLSSYARLRNYFLGWL